MTKKDFEIALKNLASGDGLYVGPQCIPEDDNWAQEVQFRQDYARAVLKGENPETAWARLQEKATAHFHESLVRYAVRLCHISEEDARRILRCD